MKSVSCLLVQVGRRVWEEKQSSKILKRPKNQTNIQSSAPSVSADTQCRLRRRTVVSAVWASPRPKLSSPPAERRFPQFAVSNLSSPKFRRLRLQTVVSAAASAFWRLRQLNRRLRSRQRIPASLLAKPSSPQPPAHTGVSAS